MFEALFTPDTLKAAPLALIVLVLIAVLYKVVTNHNAHTDGVIDRNTEAWAKQEVTHKANLKLNERIIDLLERVLMK